MSEIDRLGKARTNAGRWQARGYSFITAAARTGDKTEKMSVWIWSK
ncbi:MAG: hypothetical protein ACLUDF_04965 [Butyricicoccus sp.]